MNKNLLKKLTLNALNELSERHSWNSCTDLLKNDPLLKGISEKEFNAIQKEWIKEFSKIAKEYGNKMLFNTFVLNLLIKKYE